MTDDGTYDYWFWANDDGWFFGDPERPETYAGPFDSFNEASSDFEKFSAPPAT